METHSQVGETLVIEGLPPPLIVPVFRLYTLTPEIQERLQTSHIYFIMRRPRLSLDAKSIQYNDTGVFATVRAQVKDRFEEFDTFLPFPRHELFTGVRPRRVWAADDYPSSHIFIERDIPEGGVWELQISDSLMMRDCVRPEFEHFHVDYIGHSLGTHGVKGAIARLVGRAGKRDSHEHLQHVQAQIASLHPDQELFVALFSFDGDEKSSRENYESYQLMTLRGPDADRFSEALDPQEAHVARIKLAEAALIRYFRPTFNQRYKDTFPSNSHAILQPLRALKIETLIVRAVTFNIGAMFYTEDAKSSFDHRAVYDVRVRPRMKRSKRGN